MYFCVIFISFIIIIFFYCYILIKEFRKDRKERVSFPDMVWRNYLSIIGESVRIFLNAFYIQHLNPCFAAVII